MINSQDKLWTKSFISISIGNFLLFFSFYLLIPIFPLYLIEVFNASKFLTGLVLSSYVLSALLIRPIAGFILDQYHRRPQYLVAFLFFTLLFISYPLVTTVNLFLFFRIVHGFTFGYITTASNSVVVDILPSSNRGKGLGFFGVANNLAMVFGPMISLFLHGRISFQAIFSIAIISGLIGFVFAMNVKSPRNEIKSDEKSIALDRFFLIKGFKSGFSLLLIGIPYGMLMTYLAVYGMELGVKAELGLFFTIMAVGLVGSRLISGAMIDQGRIIQAIKIGLAVSVVGMFLLATLQKTNEIYPAILPVLFLIIPMILGLGYGLTFPAYNTLFVNLAPNNRRATASSTFMTSWDLGVGLGLIIGGRIADSTGGLPLAYFLGSMMIVLSLGYFHFTAGPHFLKNKLR